jgi:hypothetical protein
MITAALIYAVVIWAVGRRYGKTKGAIQLCYIEAARHKGLYKFAYCSPTYKRAREVYQEFVQLFRPLIKKKRDSDLYVELIPFGNNAGVKGWFWSLEQHDNLRGEGLNRVIVDECADVVSEAYYATLMPMLADGDGGKALLLGTPKRVGVGFTWFRAEFTKGEDAVAFPHHKSGKGPSEENPHLSKQVLARLREDCIDDLTRREEYDAEWITEEGAVFERLDEAFVLPVLRSEGRYIWIGEEPRPEGKYIAGLDLARFEDFTVLSIFDRRTRRQVAVMRCQGEEYEYQLKLISELRARYNRATVVVDEQGAGTPVMERLRREYGDGARAKKWTNRNKEEDITRARLLFQRTEWTFLDLRWQRNEFQVYTRELLEISGKYRYAAPHGMHDDAVVAAALASEILALPFIAERRAQQGEYPFTLEALDRLERRNKWRDYFRRIG